jgi:uncharacterized protein YjiS (DUF1127 family)
MSLIVQTFRRFVFLIVYFVRRPSAAPALYRDAVTLWRSRRALADLNDSQLLDVGLTREDVQREINRPFWADRAPWATDDNVLLGEAYLRGRSLNQVRSFYRERGRTVISHHR